jgi:SulP family sulfate permease
VTTAGGVGYFLMQTGIEGRVHEFLSHAMLNCHLAVTSGFPLEYNLDYLKIIFEPNVLALWGTSLGLAVLLRLMMKFCKHPLFVPSFFLITPAVFFIVVFCTGTTLDQLRAAKWLYPSPAEPEPFYKYFEFIDLTKVSWMAIAKTTPVMVSLTFFGKFSI